MSILVGMPWLRQLRIKKSKLWSEYIIFVNKQVIKKDCLNLTMELLNWWEKNPNIRLESAS